jgi:hypothetical protein
MRVIQLTVMHVVRILQRDPEISEKTAISQCFQWTNAEVDEIHRVIQQAGAAN